MMEYILTGVAGIAVFFLVMFLIYNRRQEIKIKKNIREIKRMQTGHRDHLNFFE